MNDEDISKILCQFQTENETSEIKDETSEIDNCVYCHSALYTSEDGFMTCSSNSCGIIHKHMLDRTAEWRFFNGDKSTDPTRCGMPINPLLRESSFGCRVIQGRNTSYEMRKIKRYTEWQSMPYKEKSQYDEFERIKMMANNAGISKCIIDEALRLHNKISKERTFRALNRDGVIAASIYLSGKMNNYPRTAKEIATIFNLDKSSATKGCKNASMILNKIERNLDSEDKTVMCQTKPLAFIERYCSKLRMNSELTKLCQFIAIRIDKNNLVPENTPHSIATGIIYFVAQMCKLNISKRDVRNISDISEVTINKCCKKLMNIKDQLIPPCILEKYN